MTVHDLNERRAAEAAAIVTGLERCTDLWHAGVPKGPLLHSIETLARRARVIGNSETAEIATRLIAEIRRTNLNGSRRDR